MPALTVRSSSAAAGATGAPAPAGSRTRVASLLLVFVGLLALPLGLRFVNRVIPNARLEESYVPAIEAPRERAPFEGTVVDDLRRSRADYVIIGDSMAGTRIDHRYLSQLAGAGVAPILHPGSGSAYWYLVFKNWVVASRIRPKAVIFFFRDENLTDPLFRAYTGSLDRVARAREPVLNEILAAHANGGWFRLHALAGAVYQFDRTRAWIEPLLVQAPVPFSAARRWRSTLLERMNDQLFTLDALRPMAAADMAVGDAAKFDFAKNLPISVLPEILRLAKLSDLKVAFIRVQRRPLGDRPPVQSPALQAYVRQLKTYLEANGAYFHDDWGDPDQPLHIYEDGDHIARGYLRYTTELFFKRNPELFR